MPDGVIVGGWGSVVAAYGVTVLTLAGYVWSVFHRRASLVSGQDIAARQPGASEEDGTHAR